MERCDLKTIAIQVIHLKYNCNSVCVFICVCNSSNFLFTIFRSHLMKYDFFPQCCHQKEFQPNFSYHLASIKLIRKEWCSTIKLPLNKKQAELADHVINHFYLELTFKSLYKVNSNLDNIIIPIYIELVI